MGFPWCKCGNRDPKGTPISIKYTGVQTAGKHRYACFALSVDSSYDPSCAECSKMVSVLPSLPRQDLFPADLLTPFPAQLGIPSQPPADSLCFLACSCRLSARSSSI